MRRRIMFPGLNGFFNLFVRAILSALIFNAVSTFLKQLFDEQEQPLAESPVQGKVIDVKAEQVIDA
ncbi:MAG: hypothetical protein KF716_27160 [Anaerolineae bacterium]|nr:hypothetical protein [Anaerolineae bacterium]